jgi:hypothetical protein
MIWKKSARNRDILSIELLQNGVPIAGKTLPLNKSQRLSIGNKRWHSLSVPFYPFAKTIKGIKIRGNSLHLDLPVGWMGNAVIGGKRVDRSDKDKKKKVLKLRMGDYGFFHRDDLCLIVKLHRNQAAKSTASVLRFPAQAWSLIAHEKSELNWMLASAALSVLLLSPFMLYLSKSAVKRPTTIQELESEYVLPFVYPLHFKNLPEALQQELDRRDYKSAAIEFSNALTSMFLNKTITKPKLLFQNSVKLHTSQDIARNARIGEIRSNKDALNQRILSRDYTALVHIPSIKGESLRGSILRIFDKVDLMHQSLEQSLNTRRSIIADYSEDPEYDYTDYKSGSIKQSRAAKEALSKVSPFSLLTNEEQMYFVAEDLARHAMGVQKAKAKHAEHHSIINPDFQSIAIHLDAESLNFLDLDEFHADDQKINALVASELGTSSQQRIKEPLIGEIAPVAIENLIKKRLFELRLCYELALRRDASASGSMELKWRIDSYGKISDIALVSSSIDDKTMQSCVKQKIARWIFPKPKRGSVEVSFPFIFERDKG